MKRKISQALAPLKMANKAEDFALQLQLSVNSSSDSLPMPDSPYINRQFVDAKTVSLLRSACASIVAETDIPDEYLEYTRQLASSTGRPPTDNHNSGPQRYSYKSGHSLTDVARTRGAAGEARVNAQNIYKQYSEGPPPTLRQSKPLGSNSSVVRQEHDARSRATYKIVPLCPTAAEIAAPSNIDAAFRRQYVQAYEEQQKSDREESRPASRAGRSRKWSFDGIRNYIKPGSAASSRPASRSGSRGPSRAGFERPSSSGGWRSWTSPKVPNDDREASRIDSAFSSNRASHTNPVVDDKREVNLNRALPPLPSLSTWTDNDNVTSPMSPRVASLKHESPTVRSRKHDAEKSSPQLTRSSTSRHSDGGSSIGADVSLHPSSSTTTMAQPIELEANEYVPRSNPNLRLSMSHNALGLQARQSMLALTPVNIPSPRSATFKQERESRRSPQKKPARSFNPSTNTMGSATALPDAPQMPKPMAVSKNVGKKDAGLAASVKKLLRGWGKNSSAAPRTEVIERDLPSNAQPNGDWMHSMESRGVKRGVIIDRHENAPKTAAMVRA